MLNVEKLKVRKRDNMKNKFRKEFEEQESKEMLDIIHNNCIKIRNNKKRVNKINKMLNKFIIILVIIFIGSLMVFLNNDRKEAINNCMKNHSENYCTKISG